jgi:sensor c-di-GMP phosphodiesterase-like protein
VQGDPASTAIVSAVVKMAHALELSVVAEGVETEEQAAVLRRLGCGQAQGWHFGYPVPASELVLPRKQFVAAWRLATSR